MQPQYTPFTSAQQASQHGLAGQQYAPHYAVPNYANPRSSKRPSSKHVKPVVNNFVEPGRLPMRKSSLGSSKKVTVSASKPSGTFSNKRNSNTAAESCAEIFDRNQSAAYSGSASKKRPDSENFYHYGSAKAKNETNASVSHSMPYFQI